MERFPTVESLAAAPLESVLEAWAGLGYYSRARNLHKGARQIVDSRMPASRDEWLEIPGVGPYTAGAVASIAFDQPEAIVDGNVERVFSRLWRLRRSQGEARYKRRIWNLSRAWVRVSSVRGLRPSVVNQALMELGALVCTPRQPMCGVCPVQMSCQAFAQGVVDQFPERKKRPEVIEMQERVLCAIDPQGRVLLHRRAEGEWRGGLWDFPIESADVKVKTTHVWGEARAKLIVTRHRIDRRAQVVSADAKVSGDDYRWFEMKALPQAVGSSFKKTWQSIRETFPEALPQT